MSSKIFKQFFVFIFTISIFASCTKDEPVVLENPEIIKEEMPNGESTMQNLLKEDFEVNTNEAEASKIMCFELNFPVEIVYPNKTTTNVNSFEALETAFNTWYEENKGSREEPMLNFPVEVTLADETVESIANERALIALMKECFENENYVERKCFEFNYPLMVQIEGEEMAVSINSQEDLESTLRSNDKEVKYEFIFPIRVTLQKGEVKTLASNDDLKALKEFCGKKDKGEDKDEVWGNNADYSIIRYNCFMVDFPVELVLPDASKVVIDSEAEFNETIKTYRNDKEALSKISFSYPINVILHKDRSIVELASQDDLKKQLASCKKDELEEDDKGGFWDNWQSDFFKNDCFEVTYPIDVIIDVKEVNINSQEELSEIVSTYRENNGNNPKMLFSYPINVVLLKDNSTIQLNSQEEIRDLFGKCRENFGGFDDDRDEIDWAEIKENFEFEFLRNQCFHIQFPISFSLQDGSLVSADSFESVFEIIVEEMRTNNGDFPELNLAYPITVTLSVDRSSLTLNNEEELNKLYEECEDFEQAEDFAEDIPDWVHEGFDNEIEWYLYMGECFTIEQPFSLTVKDETIDIAENDDVFEALFNFYRGNEFELEDVSINFPVSVVLEDRTTEILNNQEDFDKLMETCEDNRTEGWGHDEGFDWGNGDFDWEGFDLDGINFDELDLSQLDFSNFEDLGEFKIFCFEVNFPIEINITTEERITVENFGNLIQQMFVTILTNRDKEIEPEVIYPITVTMEDDTVRTLNSNDEFEELAKSCND